MTFCMSYLIIFKETSEFVAIKKFKEKDGNLLKK